MKVYLMRMLCFAMVSACAQTVQADSASLQWATLGELHPTQGAIGHRQVDYKLHRYRLDTQALYDDLCESQGLDRAEHWHAKSTPHDRASYACRLGDAQRTLSDVKTAVRGPGNRLFLTDGHHTFSTFMDMPDGGADLMVLVSVTHDQSDLSEGEFWQWMQAHGQAWLFNENGAPITPQQLPQTLGRDALANDELRAGVYFLRGLSWQKPDSARPFLEFHWANALRPYLSLAPFVAASPLNRTEYMRWLERLAGVMAAAQAEPFLINTKVTGGNLAPLLCRSVGEQVRFGKLAYLFLDQEPSPRCGGDVQLLQPLPSSQGAEALSGTVLALIEIPVGSREKWEVSKTGGARLLWDRNVEFAGYPANYGTLPQTYSDPSLGGDGDPLDILILGEPLAAGSLVHVRIVGMMNMLDGGERDEKFIAVLATDPVFGALNDLVDLDTRIPALTAHIQHWFQHYKGQASSVTDLSWHTREEALAVLQGYMRNTE